MFFLPESSNFEIEKVAVSELGVVLSLAHRLSSSLCPLCAQPAHRVQSRYTRTLSDLPVSGLRVQLVVLVRRFYCDNNECKRRIFSQRFPTLTRPYAKRTDRLSQALREVGLVLGGEAGAALARKLGMGTSPDTLLRVIKAEISASSSPDPTLKNPTLTKIGLDEWSWKKGQTFGSIIVDLTTNRVVDLLQNRSGETVKKWLRDHPGIELISRDRSTEFALAASEAAPQAIQVADRFHIVRNLAEQVELLLARLRKEWRPALGIEQALVRLDQQPPQPKTLPAPDSWKVEQSRQTARKSQARREQRMDRYNQVVQLRAAGLLQREIAQRTGLSEKTIRNWLKAETYPEAGPYPKRRSIFDPYAAYVLKRWQEGQQDGHQLWQEIKVQGFKGTERTVSRFLKQLRDEQRRPLSLPQASALEGLAAKKAVWWFIREPDKLKEAEAHKLKQLREASPTLEEIYRLVQAFMKMVHQLQGFQLDGWLAEVKESDFEELQSFVRGIEKDKAAVIAGLSLPFSNGPVEGHNNRLKLIKRSMYGRAKLDLLKRRVLAQTA